MKNGEEIVSVGGAVDASLKNVGTSASNSVLLNLAKVLPSFMKSIYLCYDTPILQNDKVWLQLLRGGLVETTNRKTGYSSFSGYKIGCHPDDSFQDDFVEATIEPEDGHNNNGEFSN